MTEYVINVQVKKDVKDYMKNYYICFDLTVSVEELSNMSYLELSVQSFS